MQLMTQTSRMEEPAYLEFNTVNTTLYELIEVISNELDPDENQLIPAIVSDLCDRRLIQITDSMEKAVADNH